MTTSNDKKAERAFRALRKMRGTDRLERRAEYMQSLPDDIRWRVARLAAGGEPQ